MPDDLAAAPAAEPQIPRDEITSAQRQDLVELFDRHLFMGMIEWLGDQGLGAHNAVAELRADGQSKADFARAVIERLHETGKLGEVITMVRTEATRDGWLLERLNHVMAGRRLSELPPRQATVHAGEEPFFDTTFFEEIYPTLQRCVCAVGLGDAENINQLMGTGFLIGPDLVMTNYHVIDKYVTEVVTEEMVEGQIRKKRKFEEKVPGDNIFCFFDYLAAPQPDVPPKAGKPHPSVVVQAVSEKWLVDAKTKLPGEGVFPYPDHTCVTDQFDYAVIRLRRPIGEVPCRSSGGAPRGWLQLSNAIDTLAGKRVIVLQHPQKSHQLFDIGDFWKLDPSTTRVWYAVNTGFGSSGGAAVGMDGRLYALHVAEVKAKNNNGALMYLERKVNQGVRIDKIFASLSQPEWLPKTPPDGRNPGYWSLADSIEKAEPIIGRQHFRESVLKMMRSADERLLTVVGPPGSGRNFSVILLKRILGSAVPVIEFSPADLEKHSPESFLNTLRRQLMLPVLRDIPDRTQQTVTFNRWLNFELPNWLAQALAAGQQGDPARYPCWIVINTVGRKQNIRDPDPQLNGQFDKLHELIGALTGGHDPAHPVADIGQLRWLMLGATVDQFPPTRWPRIVDNLQEPHNVAYGKDYAACLQLAWWASGRKPSKDSPELLAAMATTMLRKLPNELPRAFLAQMVHEVINTRGLDE